MHMAPLPEAVAEVVLRQYHSLPKTGKPQPNEHSVLAGFAISLDENSHDTYEEPATEPGCCRLVPVALGTGTKCVGSRQDRHQIDVINDSHAEVSIPLRALQAHVTPAAPPTWVGCLCVLGSLRRTCTGQMLSTVGS